MIEGRFVYPVDRVVYGQRAAAAVAEQAKRLRADRVFLIASRALANRTDEIDRIREALGPAFAGSHDGIPPHNPRDAVVAAAAAAREAGADLVVSVGGGSVTDCAKLVLLCLEHDIRESVQMEAYRVVIHPDGRRELPRYRAPRLKQVAVPTTLSGGEFNMGGGSTEPTQKLKQHYAHPALTPTAVVLDPAITVHTPQWLWLSTGLRAVDHAVEAICSTKAHPFVDAAALHALRLLGEGLRRCKASPEDLDARQRCQFGVWLSMTGIQAYVPMGASHAIGHVLGGTFDVPHGYTSCVMLPAVLRYNEAVNADRQRLVSEALGCPERTAADAVGALIADLGLPRRLGDVGVGEAQFDLLARNAMHDRFIHTNPRPIRGPEDVQAILRLAV